MFIFSIYRDRNKKQNFFKHVKNKEMERPKRKVTVPIEDEDKLDDEEKTRPQKKRKDVIKKEELRAGWKNKLQKRASLEKYAKILGVVISYPKNRKKRLPKSVLLEKILDEAIRRRRSLHQNWITRVDNKQYIHISQNPEHE